MLETGAALAGLALAGLYFWVLARVCRRMAGALRLLEEGTERLKGEG